MRVQGDRWSHFGRVQRPVSVRDAFGRLVDDAWTVGCTELTGLAPAVRTRVLRLLCVAAGAPADALTRSHVAQVDALVSDWRGQGPVALPGGMEAARLCGRLCLRPSRRATWSASGA